MIQGQNNYVKRYLKFWQHFHPEQQINLNLQKTAHEYNDKCIENKIIFDKFDEICTAIENEFVELPYTFNLIAYCLDWILSEKQDQMQNQIDLDNQPIILPQEGKPIRLIDNPNIKNALEKIKKNNPALLKILERINLHRVKTTYHVCAACNNTGFVLFGVDYLENGNETIEVYNHSKNYYLTKVKRCDCSKGQEEKQKCDKASKYECFEAARINSGEDKELPF